MKRLLLITLLGLLTMNASTAQTQNVTLITADIENFWNAYDKIIATKDTTLQRDYLSRLFLDKGTPGLKAMMKAREYTEKSYLDAINSYPLFWSSIRANTLRANAYAKGITANVATLRKLYPDLKPSAIYFTIGAFRSGGTTEGHLILIGSEIAMGDKNTVTTEFPKSFESIKKYYDSEPLTSLVFTNIHEYVHTQQKTTEADNLLGQAVLEGVAEFMAEKATGQPSTLPAKKYGVENFEKVRDKFALQMFNSSPGFWLYNDANNEFNVRDLGYYVGYAMCDKYYAKAADKKRSVKEMIELDYNNQAELSRFVDATGYFSKPVSEFKKEYEAGRPVVTGIGPFKNNDTNIDPAAKQITIQFSKPMNKGRRNFELGPLGKEHLLKISKVIGFSEDGRSFTFEAELAAGQQYQLVVGSGFKDLNGAGLTPYLINIKTSGN